MVSHSLVNDANEMRSCGVELESEVAIGVALSAASFLHSVDQAKEHDVVTGSGLAGGAIGNRARESLRRSEGREKRENYEDDNCLKFQTLAPFLLLTTAFLAAASR